MQTQIDTVCHNGTYNRLIMLSSVIRLAKKSNRKVNAIWTLTLGRASQRYFGDRASFFEIFKPIENLTVDESPAPNATIYHFKYWEELDHIIDIEKPGNIFIDFALYSIVSKEDKSDIFTNLKRYICIPQEVKFDSIGEEIGEVLRTQFKPVKELQDEIDKIQKNFFKKTVAIHIRSTDGGFTEYKWPAILKKLIENCKKWTSKGPEYGVFLATDDPEKYIQMQIALGTKLVFYVPPPVLCGYRSDDKFGNDKYNVLCGVIESWLLSKTNEYLVGTAQSTFSMGAMLMADKNIKKFMIDAPENIPTFD